MKSKVLREITHCEVYSEYIQSAFRPNLKNSHIVIEFIRLCLDMIIRFIKKVWKAYPRR